MPIDVTDWLRRLGLEQYAPAFADNNIDGEVLADLTTDDLIGLGVTSIGHRRKLLGAIAQLRAAAPSTSGDDLGVMAQEVQTVVPEAVVRGSDGYLRVSYDRLGLQFQTYDR
jgi:SAM domain (Sterile alpha motif)